MKCVLLTGMSGTGKSTVTAELAARGYRAVDLACDNYSEWVDVEAKSDEHGSTVVPRRGRGRNPPIGAVMKACSGALSVVNETGFP